MSNVDVIGIEGVSKFIQSSKLSKFIIFRQGARSGSTPVYDGSTCNNVSGVERCFRDWAQNILSANPANNNPYEMLLFDKRIDLEDLDPDEEDLPKKGTAKTKMKKVRFTFCLANQMNYGHGHVNVAEAIKSALAERDQQTMMQTMLTKMEAMEARLNGDDEEDEDDDTATDKFASMLNLIKEVNRNELIKRGKGAHISGDEDDDDIGDDEDDDTLTETKMNKETAAKEIDKIKLALKLLRKNTNTLGDDLIALGKFCNKNPEMYKTYMKTVKNSVK